VSSVSTTAAASVPAISVVMITAGSFKTLRRALWHLSRQTIRDRIEVVIIAPAVDSLSDMPDGALSAFWGSQVVPVGPIVNGDKQAAAALRVARAPVIGMLEDHAYVDPDWAESLVRAIADGWTAVCTRIENANPDTALSWGSYLIAYGAWFGPQPSRPVTQVSRHNVGLLQDAVLALDPGLEDHLGRDGNLLAELASRGGRFFATTGSIVQHVNASRFSSTFLLRYHGGRLSAWKRWKRGRWSPVRRLVYCLVSPVFPVLRYVRIRGDLKARDAWRLVPGHGRRGLAVALVIDAMGQGLGFAFGTGRHTVEYLARFEYSRAEHLVRGDLAVLEPPVDAGR